MIRYELFCYATFYTQQWIVNIRIFKHQPIIFPLNKKLLLSFLFIQTFNKWLNLFQLIMQISKSILTFLVTKVTLDS